MRSTVILILTVIMLLMVAPMTAMAHGSTDSPVLALALSMEHWSSISVLDTAMCRGGPVWSTLTRKNFILIGTSIQNDSDQIGSNGPGPIIAGGMGHRTMNNHMIMDTVQVGPGKQAGGGAVMPFC